MKVPRLADPKQPAENTIALINIVFLMLIFFLIAGSLTPPLDPDVDLIDTTDARPVDPPLALFVTSKGELRYQGEVLTAAVFVGRLKDEGAPAGGLPDEGETELATGPAVRLAADGELPATRLVEVIDKLKGAGAGRITIITERKMQ